MCRAESGVSQGCVVEQKPFKYIFDYGIVEFSENSFRPFIGCYDTEHLELLWHSHMLRCTCTCT